MVLNKWKGLSVVTPGHRVIDLTASLFNPGCLCCLLAIRYFVVDLPVGSRCLKVLQFVTLQSSAVAEKVKNFLCNPGLFFHLGAPKNFISRGQQHYVGIGQKNIHNAGRITNLLLLNPVWETPLIL